MEGVINISKIKLINKYIIINDGIGRSYMLHWVYSKTVFVWKIEFMANNSKMDGPGSLELY